MKHMRKVFALALTLIMALALTVPAFAAPLTGSIEVKNATVGEEYAGYKVFDVTYSGTNGKNLAYTITKSNQFYDEVSADDSPFALTAAYGVENTYVVAKKDGVTDAQIIAWLQALIGKDSTYTADLTATTATSASVKWTSVPCGYYLITSGLGATVTVDTNNPNVTIIDKNQIPGSDPSKTIGDDTLQIGETGTFTISFGATNYDGDQMITKYTITDNMPDGMTLDNTSIVVKVGEATLADTAYTVTYDTTDPDDFTITIPWATGTGENMAPSYESPITVTVTYNAKLTSAAAIAGEGNTNKAKVEWTKADNTKGSTNEFEETVYTFALAIKKVDKSGNPLANAKFTVKNGDAVVYMTDDSNGVYTVCDATTQGAVTEVVSPASGLIIIKGVDSDKYTLTEIEAPNGYNLLAEAVEVTPVQTSATTTNTKIWLDENGNVTKTEGEKATEIVVEISDIAATAVAVVNFTGAELPSTGGIGSTIFYMVGGILMAGAAILLITKKKMSNEQ